MEVTVLRRRIRNVLMLAGATLLATLSVPTTSAASTPRRSVPAATVPAGTKVAETSAITRYADAVTTLGISRFPSTFTSASLTNATTVTVYATKADTKLLSALRALPAHGAHLVVDVVAHSFSQLDALARRIGTDRTALRSSQVNVSSVAFDAPHGRLLVTLARPTGAVSAATTTAMVHNARTSLDARYGSAWISVADTTEALATTSAERDGDGSPFTGGDGINLSGLGVTCSLGFTTKGNNSGNDYLLTAGHCGKGTVTAETNGVTIGSVSTQYLDGGSDADVDTIRANGRARVWYGGDFTTSYYTVSGSVVPANGSAMTVDGDENPPQHTGQTVSNNEIYTYLNDEHYGEIYIGPMVQLSSTACIAGNSGGPAYVRNGSTGTVNAVGTISGTGGGHCYIFWISKSLGIANLSLVTG
jgi:hypothetical protein